MPPKPGPDEGLDFQFTDFGEARQALDELPPGVGSLAEREPGYWLRRRRPAGPADRALTGPAMDWLMKLPGALQPRRTSVLYPRIVNMIAEVASSPREMALTIESLLDDRRGNRRGLPEPVRQELTTLHEHARARLAVAASQATATAEELQRARRLLEAAGYRVIAPGG